MIARTYKLLQDVTDCYNTYKFHNIYKLVYNFINNELSSIYMDITKDRLYSGAAGSDARRSAQNAYMIILEVMVRILSPILSFTCDEVWENYPEAERNAAGRPQNVQLAGWPVLDDFIPKVSEEQLNDAYEKFQKLLEVRDVVTPALEEKRVAGEINKSQEAGVKLVLPEDFKPIVDEFGAHTFETLFIVSDSQIDFGGDEIKVEVVKAKGEKCPRCWNYRELGENGVCERCGQVLKDLNFNFND